VNERLLAQLVDAIATAVSERISTELPDAPATTTPASPWMSADAAAACLDIPKARLYKLTAQGAIPHYKQDGRLFFHRQELDEWMSQFRQRGDWISAGNRAISP
jgi:excisionase family DNA binding protein